MLLGLFVKDAPVIDTSDVLLPHHPIRGPDEQVRRRPLQECRRPPEEVGHHALALPELQEISNVETTLVVAVVLGENVFEVLRFEAAFIVVGHAVAAVFVFVDPGEVNAEERVRKERWAGGVGQSTVDYQGDNEG